MAQISVEPVPKEFRTPSQKYQVIVDGSIVSRHRTKSQARERARQARGNEPDRVKNISERAIEAAKVGSPVDASLEPMGGGNMSEFVSNTPDIDDEQEEDPWGNIESMAMLGGGDDEEDDGWEGLL